MKKYSSTECIYLHGDQIIFVNIPDQKYPERGEAVEINGVRYRVDGIARFHTLSNLYCDGAISITGNCGLVVTQLQFEK